MNEQNNNVNNQVQNNSNNTQSNYYAQGVNNPLNSNGTVRGINDNFTSSNIANNVVAPTNTLPVNNQNGQIIPPSVGGVPTNSLPVNNQNGQPIPPSKEPENKGGKFRTFLLIVFFIFLIVFVIFLPDISEFLRSGKIAGSNDNELKNGVLVCTTERDNDMTSTSYQLEFKFVNKELLTSTFNITTESEDKMVINENHNGCKNLELIAEDLGGIDVTCTSSQNINTMLESYNYRLINYNGLTKFTEAGGTYPEYKYKDNIYDIKGKLINSGYDCKIKAS